MPFVTPVAGISASHYKLLMEAGGAGAHDPTTTNVYLGNLHPEISEQVLMMEFGKYGIPYCCFFCSQDPYKQRQLAYFPIFFTRDLTYLCIFLVFYWFFFFNICFSRLAQVQLAVSRSCGPELTKRKPGNAIADLYRSWIELAQACFLEKINVIIVSVLCIVYASN